MVDNKKLHDFNIGRVKATIYENQGAEGNWLTVTFLRLYKKDEKWKTTPRFKRDDLSSLAEAAVRAQEWMDGEAEKGSGPTSILAGSEEEERIAER